MPRSGQPTHLAASTSNAQENCTKPRRSILSSIRNNGRACYEFSGSPGPHTWRAHRRAKVPSRINEQRAENVKIISLLAASYGTVGASATGSLRISGATVCPTMPALPLLYVLRTGTHVLNTCLQTYHGRPLALSRSLVLSVTSGSRHYRYQPPHLVVVFDSFEEGGRGNPQPKTNQPK